MFCHFENQHGSFLHGLMFTFSQLLLWTVFEKKLFCCLFSFNIAEGSVLYCIWNSKLILYAIWFIFYWKNYTNIPLNITEFHGVIQFSFISIWSMHQKLRDELNKVHPNLGSWKCFEGKKNCKDRKTKSELKFNKEWLSLLQCFFPPNKKGLKKIKRQVNATFSASPI